ncbi:MAG TPA: AraC family transcriptional regulator [Clostridia bacterium]|nr:AraC family transcriptional regulator [Clostridia bacterium]
MQDLVDSYGFHFLDGMDAAPIELLGVGMEKRYSPAYRFDNRERSPSYLFQYTLEGCGVLERDGQRHPLPPGHAFFVRIPGNDLYYQPVQTQDQPWGLLYAMFQGDAIAPYYEHFLASGGAICALDRASRPIQALFALHQSAKRGSIVNSFQASALGFDFLCQLISEASFPKKSRSENTERATSWMEARFASIESIENLARALNVSHEHFSRVFARDTGMTPILYLTRIRLNHAMRLLRETGLPLDDIARQCGYADGHYLGKVFRRRIGITPQGYRDQTDFPYHGHIRL